VKIVGLTTTPFREPLSVPASNANAGATCLLVELLTDTELTGFAVARLEAARAINCLGKELLTGADASAAMGLWERMGSASSAAADPVAALARAALDIALWDLKAKANGEPLWKTLGGSRPRAKAHLGWDGPADDGRMLEWFQRMSIETGIRAGSMPASTNPATDLGRLAEVRKALRATVPESALMLHFDGTGWPNEAIRHVRALETSFDLTWVRSPVRYGDYQGARKVADSISAAVCMGHGFSGIEAFRPYLRHYAANVFELDIGTLGISGSIQMADAAFGFELPVALSSHPGHLATHLFSALPTPMSIEIGYRACSGTICSSDLALENGHAVAGNTPGNGLSIDRDALAAAQAGESP
jgi:L-alanine-DL-glutamate epimerase-like enolase superfamily enzyme